MVRGLHAFWQGEILAGQEGASNVSENIYELIEHSDARYEVLPYYVVQEETHGTARRIQAGFDIEVYGIKPSHVRHPGRDYVLGCVALEKLVESELHPRIKWGLGPQIR